MKSFNLLYDKVVNVCVKNKIDEELRNNKNLDEFDDHHLDCLLNPDKKPPVIRLSECTCTDEQKEECAKTCLFDAISKDKNKNIVISDVKCNGCMACIVNCKTKNLTDRKDILPIFELLNNKEPVYAMIAPAFISQFSDNVTPGKLRSAFKKLGFAGMIEVALFADILTLKEALEFDKAIQNDEDFLLTSCCCPIWIAMIRKIYNQFVTHIPASVSPMVACGRSIKKLYPNSRTVFIGPCVAKKAEAKEKDINDAVDYVLTFQETQDIFDVAQINPVYLEEDLRDHSSTAGRIYARTGGVSEAVQKTVKRLMPNKTIQLKAHQADGVIACKALLKQISEANLLKRSEDLMTSGVFINNNESDKITANFIEGMGCVGGCVGGPKALINKENGTIHVNRYASEAKYDTPADNPYVLELLNRLGFDTIESLLEEDTFLTRKFIDKNS